MRFLPTILGAVLCLASLLRADEHASPQVAPASSEGEVATSRTGRELVESLKPEERAKLRAAVQEVWASDEVSAKREELHRATQAFRESLKAAIDQQDDPELRRVLTRLLAERYHAETRTARGNLNRAPGTRDRAADASPNSAATDRPKVVLNESEQAILASAREAALATPEVIAIVRERESAVDHQTRMRAAGRYREVMRKAMLHAEPRVAAVFLKLERAGRD